jgi:hypothetical protein
MRPGVLRPSENRNASDLRQPFLEQLNAFAHKLNGQIAHAGKIAGWSRPTLDEFTIDRITAEAEDHRLCTDCKFRIAIAISSCVTTTSGSDARTSRATPSMSSRPVAQNATIFRLRPSIHPNSRKPVRKDSK